MYACGTDSLPPPHSVVTLSVWRVYLTIIYKTGWLPTHDPTWYGSLSILLIILEINVASICASVPIFWPVISPLLGSIFVTREFSVKYEVRDDEVNGAAGDGTDGAIPIGLERYNSLSSHGRSPSDSKSTSANSAAHYKDSYIVEQVDPFGRFSRRSTSGSASMARPWYSRMWPGRR